LRLQLVELIRQCNGGDITTALQFATEQLAPRAATNSEFLKDLEKTMALLIFPHDQLQPELASLLHADLRRETANNVNDAVLRQETDRRDAAIRSLVKMRAWAESSARTSKKELPSEIDLGLNGEDAETKEEFENGHEPMITS
jgi:glucose-induced degradation protein 8